MCRGNSNKKQLTFDPNKSNWATTPTTIAMTNKLQIFGRSIPFSTKPQMEFQKQVKWMHQHVLHARSVWNLRHEKNFHIKFKSMVCGTWQEKCIIYLTYWKKRRDKKKWRLKMREFYHLAFEWSQSNRSPNFPNLFLGHFFPSESMHIDSKSYLNLMFGYNINPPLDPS